MLSFEVSCKRGHSARVLIGSRRAAARNEKLVTERGALFVQLSSRSSLLSHHIHLEPLQLFCQAAQHCAINTAVPELPVTSILDSFPLCPGSSAVDGPPRQIPSHIPTSPSRSLPSARSLCLCVRVKDCACRVTAPPCLLDRPYCSVNSHPHLIKFTARCCSRRVVYGKVLEGYLPTLRGGGRIPCLLTAKAPFVGFVAFIVQAPSLLSLSLWVHFLPCNAICFVNSNRWTVVTTAMYDALLDQ